MPTAATRALTLSRFVLLLAAACAALHADQVTLKNGDRISGTVVKYDGKNLVLKSELAGEVTIAWPDITGIVSTTTLHVGLKDGQTVIGTVQSSDSNLRVETKDAGPVSAPLQSVVFLRSKEEQAAYDEQIERYRNPRLTDLWAGSLDLGFAQSKGNADAQTFNLSANAARVTTRDKMAAYFTAIYSNGTVGSNANTTTANARRGGIGYNVNLTKKWFAFGSVDLEADQFQSLDLRFVPAGGLGYHVIAGENTMLDVQAGGALNREFFSTGLNRSRAEALLGEVFLHKFTKTTSVQQKLFYYPGLSAATSRINFDLSLVTVVRKWFNWQFTFSDRYLSDPVAGRKKNDTLFTTGARITFAK